MLLLSRKLQHPKSNLASYTAVILHKQIHTKITLTISYWMLTSWMQMDFCQVLPLIVVFFDASQIFFQIEKVNVILFRRIAMYMNHVMG